MQAIILAAGKGNRLQPMTDNIPKCMVQVKDKPLICNALDRLASTGKIDKIFIVCGYMGDVIQKNLGNSYQGMEIEYIVNEKYETTNNVYSLYMVGNRIKSDCLLLECDLFYGQDVIDTIMEGEADCNILVSPFNKETMDGTVIITENENAKALLIKAHQEKDKDYSYAYKTVNIYRFKEKFFNEKLMPALETYVNTGNLQSYYELVLGSLIYYRNDDIKVNIIDENRWYEIDDMKDYERANSAEL